MPAEEKQAMRVGAYGVVRDKEKVLLVEHATGPYMGKLALPGGKIEHGESPEQALRRELQEEVCGTFVSMHPLDNFHVTVEVEETHFHQIGMIYTVSDFVQSNGTSELKHGWYDLATLSQDRLSPFVQQLVKRFPPQAAVSISECSCRQAGRSDFRALSEMRWDFKLEEGIVPRFSKNEFLEYSEAWLQKGLSSGQWVYWVAEREGWIVSQVFCCRVGKVPTPSRIQDAYAYLTNVYTKPEERGKGIGSALMQQVKEWAVSEELELLIVWPSSQSERFYSKCGFEAPSNLRVLILP